MDEGFRRKGEGVLAGLERIGIHADRPPDGPFYVWGTPSGLPPPLNDGMAFFRAALERKVITVPGEFFAVNPGKRRSHRLSRFRGYVRFSFGPPLAQLEEALVRLQEMVSEAAKIA